MLEYKLKIIRPVLISSLILSVSFVAFFYSAYHFIQMTNISNSIDDVRYQIIKLQNVVVNTQAAQRGYLLTNNMVFVNDFEAGRREIDQSIAALDHMLADSEIMVANSLQKVKRLIDQNLNNLNAAIQIEMNSGAYSPHLNSSKVSVNIAALISAELAQIDDSLKQRKITIQKKIHNAMKIAVGVITFLIVSIIGVLVSGYRRTVDLFEIAVKSQQAAESYSHDAYHDSLTELPNRRYFDTHFKSVVSLARRNKQSVALVFIDLDGFKLINDQYGHDAGDAALHYFAKQLKPILRESDFLARLGGDEFAIVIQQQVDRNAVDILAKRIISGLDKPFDADGHTCQMGASVGVSLFPKNGANVVELMTAADSAMYQAKRTGKNRVVFA
jgi:diguanylate cyclase (GGDEF)-like protein